MKLTPENIRSLVEEWTGLDISKQSSKIQYTRARALYTKLCVDWLANTHTLDEIGEKGWNSKASHSTVHHYVNKAFPSHLQNDGFAELYIELHGQLKIFKRIQDENKKVIQGEAENAFEAQSRWLELQNKLVEAEIKYKRLVEAEEDPLVKDIKSLTATQKAALKERIAPAIKRVKQEF